MAPTRGVAWSVAVLLVFVTAAKLVVAANLDLFWDEAYYWQAASRLDIGYADKPFMTALLVRLGTMLLGDTRLGVRAVYLIMGAAFPFAMYLLARPMVGRRDAVLAAGASLLMPVTAFIGVLAFQDVPMLLFTVLSLAAFERARRTDGRTVWFLAGLFCACGLATHYRFVPFPLAILVYLLITRNGRALWRRKGLWLALAVAASGVVPILVFNLEHGFASFRFQVMDRNPWTFQASALRYPLEQAAAVTPLFFVALLATLADAIRRARGGDDGRALLATCAAVYLGFYFALAPWADRTHFNLHWPAAGYLPLLVLLPDALRRFAAGTPRRRLRRALAAAVPATGGLAVCAILVYLLATVWPAAPFSTLVTRQVRHELVAWSRLAPSVAGHLDAAFGDAERSRAVLVGGHYRVASALDFALRPERGVYVLDHRRNHKDGYAYQYVIWGLDQAGLRRGHAGSPALIVVQDRRFWFSSHREVAWRAGLCALFDELRYLGDYELPGGSRYFLIYAGRVRGEAARAGAPAPGSCATLPSAYVARPQRGDTVRGRVRVYGWAVDDATGVAAVEILVDGQAIGRAAYGVPWPRVRQLMPGSTDPNHPNIGYSFHWDSATVATGPHRLAIRVRANDGRTRIFGNRTVFVAGRD